MNRKILFDFLCEVFDGNPRDDSQYLASMCFESRRTTSEVAQLKERFIEPSRVRKIGFLERNDLPHLGPYEIEMFREIILGRGVTVVCGGTGSGKTSLIRRIGREALRYCCDQPKPWLELTGARTFWCNVDLTIFDDSIPHPKTNEDPFFDGEAVFQEIASRLRDSFEWLIPDKQLQARCLIQSLINSRIDLLQDAEGEFGDVVRQLQKRMIPGGKVIKAEPETIISDYDDSIDLLKQGKSRLIGRLLPFLEIATMHSREQKKFVLVIDNLDQLDCYIQRFLYHALQQLTKTSRRISKSEINIVLLMRVSSIRDSFDTIMPEMVSNHYSPDITDISFVKCTEFLLSYKEFNHWDDLSPDEKEHILSRILRFWLGLIDPVGGFNSILRSFTGTNLRNAVMQIKTWCLASVKGERRFSVGEIDSQIEIIRKGLFVYACEIIGERTIAALSTISEQVRNGSNVNLQQFFDDVYSILLDLRMLPAKKGVSDQRRRIAELAISAMTEIFREEGGKLMDNEFSTLAIGISADIHRLSPDKRAEFEEILVNISDGILAELDERAQKDGLKITETIREKIVHMAHAFASIPANPLCKRVCKKPILWKPHRIFKDLNNSEKSMSRFIAESLLFESSEFMRGQYRAINVLSSDYENWNGALLWFLYSLNYSGRDGIQVRTLLRRFNLLGYTRDDLATVLDLTIKRDTHLAFSSRDDYDEVPSEPLLKNTAHTIYLTWAGKGYYDHLCKSVTYLQWCVYGLEHASGGSHDTRREGFQAMISNTSVSERFCSLLNGLNRLVALEYERLRRAVKKDHRDSKAIYKKHGLAALDLFFGVLEDAVILVSSTVPKTQKKSGGANSREILIVNAFLDWADIWIKFHTTDFEFSPDQWFVSLRESVESVKDRIPRLEVISIGEIDVGQPTHLEFSIENYSISEN